MVIIPKVLVVFFFFLEALRRFAWWRKRRSGFDRGQVKLLSEDCGGEKLSPQIVHSMVS